MKKYIKYLIPSILIVILLILIFIVNINNLENNYYEKIDIKNIFDDINSFNKNNFIIVENGEESKYLPIDYSKAKEYIMGINTESNEFVLIINSLDEEEYKLLKQYIDKLNEHKDAGEYVINYELIKEKDYVIVTSLQDSNSSFKGILNSYVYCK